MAYVSVLQKLLIWTTICVCIVSGFGNNYWRLRERFGRDKHKRLLKQKQMWMKYPDVLPVSPTVEQFLEQPLDHFDPRVKTTYKQRYWANTDYWKKPDGPVFLFIGGEAGLSPFDVLVGEHVELAKRFNALIFAVEHRFYGASINKDGLGLEQMQYLSSQQALADLASFHMFASKKYNLSNDNTWICFGGSYPGALSAWFRVKYPHLVYGAVASSAPVRAKVNFEGYNEVVAASLSDPIVNGSKQCAENIKAAFDKVDAMVDNKELAKLSADFMSCKPVSSSQDVYQMASNLADIFMSTVQYNEETPSLTVDRICKNMTQPSAQPYTVLQSLNKYMLQQSEQNCSDNSWENFIKQLSNTTTSGAENMPGMRQWIYQTCTQFGYYQTCDKNTTCIFSKYLSLQPNLDVCQSVFGISPDQVYSQADFSNAYYGADNPKGTRIIFVNGSVDPWHALSVLKDLSSSEKAIYILGTAHCANMEPSEPNDPEPLKRARAEIEDQISWWITEARGQVTKDTTLYFKSNL